MLDVSNCTERVYALERNGCVRYPADVPTTLGQNITSARTAAGFEKRDLATKLGVEYQTIQDLEDDRQKDVGTLRLLKVATALKTPIEHLVGGVNVDYDRMRSDLLRHGGTGEHEPSAKVGAHASSSSDARILQDRIAALENELTAANRLIRQFRKLAGNATRNETAPPQKARSRGRRGN